MSLGRVKRKGQGQTYVGNCISIRQDITAVAYSVLPRKPSDNDFPLMIVKQQIGASDGDAVEYAEFQVTKKSLQDWLDFLIKYNHFL